MSPNNDPAAPRPLEKPAGRELSPERALQKDEGEASKQFTQEAALPAAEPLVLNAWKFVRDRLQSRKMAGAEQLPEQPPANFFAPILRELSSVAAQDRARSSAPEGEAAVEGDPQAAGALLARRMEQMATPREQTEFLSTVCAATLDRIERLRAAGPEDLTDMTIRLLGRLDTHFPAIGIGHSRAVPYLRKVLNQDSNRDQGWHQSLVALGTLLSRAAQSTTNVQVTRETRLMAAFYNHEILATAARQFGAVGSAGMVALAAGNLNSLIGDLLQSSGRFSGSTMSPAWGEIAATLRHIQLAGTQPESIPEPPEIGAFSALGIEAGGDPKTWPSLLDVFDRTEMAAWAGGPDNERLAFRHAVGGLARLVLHIGNRTASSFFNAAVTLRRMQRTDATPPAVKKRIPLIASALNALGLYWSLVMNDGLTEALLDGDGFDCAINLFGGLSSLTPDGGGNLAEILSRGGRATAEALWQARNQIRVSAADSEKLRRSLAEMDVKVDDLADRSVTIEPLRAAAWSLARVLAGQKGIGAALPEDRPIGVEETVAILRAIFTSLLGGDAQFTQEAAKLWTEMAGYLAGAADFPGLVRERYGPGMQNGAIFRTLLGEGIVSEGDLKDAGIVRGPGDQYLLQDTSPYASIGEALREAYKAD